MADNEHVQQDALEQELSSIPDKLKGKSPEDLVKMYLEAESKSSRVANELGEARRMVAQLLEVKPKEAETKKEPVRQEITADDLLADPNKSLDERISTHPEVVQARQRAEQLERDIQLKEFEKDYPGYKQDMGDAKFAEWVQKNEGRKRLIFMANQYDMAAARALWEMWGEFKDLNSKASATAAEAEKRVQAEKQGTLEGSTGADASSEVILSRADLRELQRKAILGDKAALAKWNDPKFRALRLQAYADGRAE